MHFNGRFVLSLIDFAGQLGADKNELIGLTGLTREALSQEDCRFGQGIYNRVMESAVELTGDPLFGLHSGENLNLAAAGLINQIAQTSSTVEQALLYCCEFANLGCSALPTELHRMGDDYKLTLRPVKAWMDQSTLSVEQTVYGYLAFSVREFQSITRNAHVPKEVWLTCEAPPQPAEVERVTGCSVKFRCAENAIIFDRKHVELPVATSDFELLRILVSHAEEKERSLQNEMGFYGQVKRVVVNLVKPEFPAIEQIAAHLNMSVRTFQRKLKEEGHTYKQLIDELRKEFAINYLKKDALTVSEIAYLLDYADASAFVRSFKRWTKTTPAQFRAQANQAA
ncbi:MAG: AraC family transcriptional regulator ligand-binding domain-containing protein [Cryomorphaceae bacterium]